VNSGVKKVCNKKHVDSFGVSEGDIVVDVGAAEGNFALSVVEKANKVYIIEGNAAWCDALRQTFLPYKEKVEIIQKFLSDVADDDHVTFKCFNRKLSYTSNRFFENGYRRV
jgi:16S rRNA A1518/A1519 N6-dimethyltransferase RsmA/KsgA/DIM1 with predicted DNA glycosylase/AP lyase activity